MSGLNVLLESLQRMLTIIVLAGIIWYAYQYQLYVDFVWELIQPLIDQIPDEYWDS